jgi:hypothetical protein
MSAFKGFLTEKDVEVPCQNEGSMNLRLNSISHDTAFSLESIAASLKTRVSSIIEMIIGSTVISCQLTSVSLP